MISSDYTHAYYYHSCPSINAIGFAPPGGESETPATLLGKYILPCLNALQTPRAFLLPGFYNKTD
jgi:hypothetical protein